MRTKLEKSTILKWLSRWRKLEANEKYRFTSPHEILTREYVVRAGNTKDYKYATCIDCIKDSIKNI